VDRFQLQGRRQIEVLKSCLDPSLNNWFIVTQENLPVDAEWLLWRQELIANFGDNSFKAVANAIGFKYLGGSLIDYVINKEKVLLECNRGYSKSVMLDLIIFGLPEKIVKSLNKNSITTLQSLKDKLKKYEGDDKFSADKSKFNKNRPSSPTSFRRQNNNTNVTGQNSSQNNSQNFVSQSSKVFTNSNSSERKSNNVNFVNNSRNNVSPKNRKPCSICERNGYPGKMHPESNCWYAEKDTLQKSVNCTELAESNTDDDIAKN